MAYLYRAVDSAGDTIDFYLSKNCNNRAAKNFFRKALRTFNSTYPRVITVDKNSAYTLAISAFKAEKKLKIKVTLRQIKYLNNIVE